MGCNAWNHPANCQCGWGGDTGGGGLRSGPASVVRHLKIPDGLEWSRTGAPQLASFVNPNARCPVCGADVFFYQSPAGGRVFFDALGPPWPKHPCTDIYIARGRRDPVLPPTAGGGLSPPSRLLNPTNWAPLLPTKIESGANVDLFYVDQKATSIPGRFLALPASVCRDVPLFWRRHSSDPALIDVSTVSIGAETFGAEARHSCASWTSSMADLDAVTRGEPLSATTLNHLGWWLSFHWRSDQPDWYQVPTVDWPLAQIYFQKAADLGSWAAQNNLGVIYRDGLGVAPDPGLAFRYFEQAAKALEPLPLRHLARCFRTGFGVPQDDVQADFIDELADLHDRENQDKLGHKLIPLP